MTIFLTIVLVLVVVNTLILVASISFNGKQMFSIDKETTGTPLTKIYPIDLSSSIYKKAI